MQVNLDDYDYLLPERLIAQEPPAVRDQSRLMVLDSVTGELTHTVFSELPSLLTPNDVLVVNDTKVFPARLLGHKADTGGEVEIFLLTPQADSTWEALCRPARRLSAGTRLVFGDEVLHGEIVEKGVDGRVIVALTSSVPLDEAIDRIGSTPLPPYIRREATTEDRERYQTVYARERGAVAAPTAGLHFTGELLERIAERGITRAQVTLHVGIGTFRPLDDETAAGDNLHREYCEVSPETVATITAAREAGGKVVAVGTTTARALESASQTGTLAPFAGWTDLFIKPPYRFRSVDALITNFHLPRSSLLMLVSAFAGREQVLHAYETAVTEEYRFYSYGDAMLIRGGGI